MCVISYTLEEYSTSQQTDLQGRDVNVGAVLVPCPRADGVANDSGEQTIKVEEEEEGEDAGDEDLDKVDPVEAAARSQGRSSEARHGRCGRAGASLWHMSETCRAHMKQIDWLVIESEE